MAIGTGVTKVALDPAVQADAQWFIDVVKTVIARHQQYVDLPNAAALEALGYTVADANAIIAIGSQYDRLNTLLVLGTVPASATQAIVDASNVLDATHGFPSGV
jgi:hypothetical protein